MTCLTHHILCPRQGCPEWGECKRNPYIAYIHTYSHAKGNGYGACASPLHQGRTQEAGEVEGCQGADLGRVLPGVGRDSRVEKKNCLPKGATSGKRVG